MTSLLANAFLTLLLALPMQEAQQAPGTSKQSLDTSMSLVGCVSATPNRSGQFTFVEAETGNTYRLTGKSVRKFAGRGAEIVIGSGSNALRVRGGLSPSPNVAAQASALDPAQAAVASREGGTTNNTGTATLEVRVQRVRAAPKPCGPTQ